MRMNATLRSLALTLALAAPAGAAPVAENPWFLHIRQNYRESSVAMNYQIRWDLADLKRSPGRLAAGLTAPFKSLDAGLRDILVSTRFDLYGVRMRPFRDLVPLERRSEAPAVEAVAAPAASVAARRKLDLSPLIEDAKRDARREARAWVVNAFFDAALPQAAGAPRWQKDAVARDLVAMADVWRSDR